MLTLKNTSIIQIYSHTIIVAGKMSEDVSIEKTLTLFSEPFWTCNQIQQLERFLPEKIPPTLSRGSKVLLLSLLLTGLADNFLSCLFFSRRFEFCLNEKFHGCYLPFGTCPCLRLNPLFSQLHYFSLETCCGALRRATAQLLLIFISFMGLDHWLHHVFTFAGI